jgi:hypothetical protein
VNKGRNSNHHLWFTVDVNAQLQNSYGQTMSWISQRQREWTRGDSTSTFLDDEYLITGNVSGTSFSGSSFSVNITRALHVALICPWIKDGTFDLIPSGKSARTVDFGAGTCDHDASVTINGHTYGIVLR